MFKNCVLCLMVVLLTAGCGSRLSSTRLAEIDSLVAAEKYDSAYQKVVELQPIAFADGKEKAHYCLLLTQTSLLTDHALESDSLIDVAIAYYERHGNDEKLSDAYYYKAEILLQHKDYTQAIVLGKKGYDLAHKIGNDGGQNKAARLIAHINCISGNYDLQLEYAKKSLEHALKIKRDKWIAYAYNNMNVAYQFQSMADSAMVYAEKAIPYLKYIDSEDLPYMLNAIGYAYMRHEPEKAKKFLKESIALKPFSSNLENLAYLYKKEGNEAEAYELWKKVLLCEDGIPTDKVLYNILQYNLSHGNLEGACEQLHQLAVIKDSLKITLEDRSIQRLQQEYDADMAKSAYERRVMRWTIVALLLFFVVLCLAGYIKYRRYKSRLALAEHQMMVNFYAGEIRKLEQQGSAATQQIADLNQKIKELMDRDSPRLARGKMLYDHVVQNGTTVRWSNDDYKCFIEFYKATDIASYTKTVKKYRPRTPHNTFFLLLYEMGKNDGDVRQIMGITQEAIRSTRHRILN